MLLHNNMHLSVHNTLEPESTSYNFIPDSNWWKLSENSNTSVKFV